MVDASIDGSTDAFAGGRGHELPVFDALCADQLFGQVFDLAGDTAQDYDFETVVGVQVNVQGRKNRLVVNVLVLSQLVREVADMVVINQRDRAHRKAVADVPLSFDKRAAYEVADSLGTVHVALLGAQGIEALEQPFISGYAEPDDLSHDGLPRDRTPPLDVRVLRISAYRNTDRIDIRLLDTWAGEG